MPDTRNRFFRAGNTIFNLDHIQVFDYDRGEKELRVFISGAEHGAGMSPDDFEKLAAALENGKAKA
jgi:hypothetical protein